MLLMRVLPQSPRYLAGRRERWPELTGELRRMGHDVPDEVGYVESTAHAETSRPSLWTLFGPAYRRDTIALFSSFSLCLMVNYVLILLVPSMLAEEGGFPMRAASGALASANLGGVGGAALGALVIQRLGSRVTMLGMSAAAAASALVMAMMPLDPRSSLGLMVMFVVSGALLDGVQTTMYALAAHVYPTRFRSTGVGAAVAFGRIGNVLAAYVGSFALGVGGTGGYFVSWAVLMAIVLASLAAVTHHIPAHCARGAARSLKPIAPGCGRDVVSRRP